MGTEIWKPLKGLVENGDYYEVSNFGNVRNYKTGRILKPGKNQSGYLQIGLYKNRKVKKFLVHRLVAIAFLPNPENLPEVNHKDENKGNNNVENLEWCDRKYNVQYSLNKPIKGIHQTTGHTLYFANALEAECKTGIKHQNISHCIQGRLPHAGFYKWEFAPYQENETNYFYQKTWVAYKAIKKGKGKGNVRKGEKVAEFASPIGAENVGFGKHQAISNCATYHENPTEYYEKYGQRLKTAKGFIWNIEWKQIPFYE